jgi:hypothetical protein
MHLCIMVVVARVGVSGDVIDGRKNYFAGGGDVSPAHISMPLTYPRCYPFAASHASLSKKSNTSVRPVSTILLLEELEVDRRPPIRREQIAGGIDPKAVTESPSPKRGLRPSTLRIG